MSLSALSALVVKNRWLTRSHKVQAQIRNFFPSPASKKPIYITMNHQHNENMPPWAQRIDNYGKQRWHKDKPVRSRNGEYIVNIVFNLVFLWIVNNIPDWHLDFIKDSFMVVLWILNVNIFVQIAGNALMLISELPVIRYLSRILIESSSFVTLMVLFYIFPFDFSKFYGLFWFDQALHIAFIIGMAVSAIKVISNLWKLIFRR